DAEPARDALRTPLLEPRRLALAALGALDQRLLRARVDARLAALRVGAVARHLPGVALVGEVDVQNRAQLALQARILDRRQHLDPALEVALHAVRGADVVLGRAAVAEVVDARV